VGKGSNRERAQYDDLETAGVVAAMYHQPPGGDSIQQGVHTLTDLVATIFGAPVPAPVVIPDVS
jgi:hypothetical protein